MTAHDFTVEIEIPGMEAAKAYKYLARLVALYLKAIDMYRAHQIGGVGQRQAHRNLTRIERLLRRSVVG